MKYENVYLFAVNMYSPQTNKHSHTLTSNMIETFLCVSVSTDVEIVCSFFAVNS